MPKFDMPKVEMPAAFREFAERGVAQAKDTYEKMKAAAEEATDVLRPTFDRHQRRFGLWSQGDRSRTHQHQRGIRFCRRGHGGEDAVEVVELTSAHARKQFETLTAQSKELGALAQKVATETAEPIKSGMNKAFNKVS